VLAETLDAQYTGARGCISALRTYDEDTASNNRTGAALVPTTI